MHVAVSRRRLLQLAMAPAFLSRAHAQVQDLAPVVSRIYPGGDLIWGGSVAAAERMRVRRRAPGRALRSD